MFFSPYSVKLWMRDISLRQVEAFKAVVECGSVSLAARALLISQPSLSRLVASLEQQIGLNLFERSKGRLVQTDHGRRFYGEVDAIFVGLDQLGRAVREIKGEETGTLRIGAAPALSGRILRQAVKEYRRGHPNIRISITVRESRLLVDRIGNGKLDVLIASRATEIRGLNRISLMKCPAVCILPMGHDLSDVPVINPAVLEKQNIIMLAETSTLPGRIRDVFVGEKRQIASSIEVSSAAEVCRFVETGLGVSLVHPLVALDSGAKLVIRPFEPAISVDFNVYRSATKHIRAHVEDFINTYQAAAKNILNGSVAA